MAASGAHLLLCLVCRLAGPPAMPHFTLEKKLKHPHHFQQTDAGNMGLRWESVVAAALAAATKEAMCATIHREKTNVSPDSLTEKKSSFGNMYHIGLFCRPCTRCATVCCR